MPRNGSHPTLYTLNTHRDVVRKSNSGPLPKFYSFKNLCCARTSGVIVDYGAFSNIVGKDILDSAVRLLNQQKAKHTFTVLSNHRLRNCKDDQPSLLAVKMTFFERRQTASFQHCFWRIQLCISAASRTHFFKFHELHIQSQTVHDWFFSVQRIRLLSTYPWKWSPMAAFQLWKRVAVQRFIEQLERQS